MKVSSFSFEVTIYRFICYLYTLEVTHCEVTVFGREGLGFCDDGNKINARRREKKCPKLFDVIFGWPQKIILGFLNFWRWRWRWCLCIINSQFQLIALLHKISRLQRSNFYGTEGFAVTEFTCTVKPVYNDHPRDPKFAAVVNRWSFFRGRFIL
jgi:hypothetical protein